MNFYVLGANDALSKYAANRWERAVESGQIQRSDVVPGMSDSTGFFNPVHKRMARQAIQTPNIDPAEVDRNRRLSAALLRNGLKQPNVSEGMHPLMGPATLMGEIGKGNAKVTTSPDAGPFMRDAGAGGLRMLRALGTTLPSEMRDQLAALPLIGKYTKTPSHPMDSTLSHAVLQHELGEAQVADSTGQKSPFASHLGSRPNMMEQLAARGDPEALAELAKVRAKYPSDARFMKLYKQHGGLPGRPLPVGGRDERNLESAMADTRPLDQAERLRRMQFSAAGHDVLLPDDAREAAKQLPTAFVDVADSISKKQIPENLGEVGKHLGAANKFLKGKTDAYYQRSNWDGKRLKSRVQTRVTSKRPKDGDKE